MRLPGNGVLTALPFVFRRAKLIDMSVLSERGFAEVWERTVQPEKGDLTPDVANYFLKVGFARRDRERMDELAAKARSGALGSDENEELENYMQLGWFLDLMKSKARLSLAIFSVGQLG
jgi:hypothetical protein